MDINDQWHDTKVNYAKLVVDLRDQFPYDALTALIVETFANAIDANASKIDIDVDTENYIFRICDNGCGMSKEQFHEYHNIASLTKDKGKSIGFAGVGAKIFLDRADYIITESKSDTAYSASEWIFKKQAKTPQWRFIETSNKIKSSTGTYVEVKLRDQSDFIIFSPDFIKYLIQQWYNAILLGFYNVKDVFVNGQRIKPWEPYPVEYQKDLDFTYEGNHIKGYFTKTSEDIPEVFQGPHIVVNGKTVQQCWFKQYPIHPEKISGLILADHLIDILTTSKAQFKYQKGSWNKFNAKIGKIFSEWLTEINAKPQTPKVSEDLQNMAEMLEKSINEILKNPLFNKLAKDIFQNLLKKTVSIKSAKGEALGILTDKQQLTSGTMGGEGEGGGVPTSGDQEGAGVEEKPEGKEEEPEKDTPIEKVKRRVKGGIKIGFDEKPEELKEAWIDPAQAVIIINTAHPAFLTAYALKSESYHMMRCIIVELLEEAGVENPKETMHDFFSTWNTENRPET
jgi:hypothetical protein